MRLWFKKQPIQQEVKETELEDYVNSGFFSTDKSPVIKGFNKIKESLIKQIRPNFAVVGKDGSAVAMDSDDTGMSNAYSFTTQGVNDQTFVWYATQGFIGYQTCAFISQNWLVDKACRAPADDACAQGYEISFPDGEDEEMEKEIKELDKKFKVNKNLREFVKFNRIFGIRIAMFIVETEDDAEYYKTPFNIDGIKKGTYKGISQVDPYWITPQLTQQSVGTAWYIDFYEPEFWLVSGMLVHKSHLCVIRYSEVADILKPSYLYGGMSLPQQIYERIYAAERTANEAPMLALTKRTTALNLDMEAATAGETSFIEKLQNWVSLRDNYGVKVLGLEEQLSQQDTSLADLDAVIMSQYQLVAAIAKVPAVRLLGTSPKGFNSTGDNELKTYHEELSQIQVNDFQPMLEKHYQLLLKSEFESDAPFDITWNPIDVPSATEDAAIKLVEAQTAQVHIDSGVLAAQEVRDILAKDKHSGYNNIDPDSETDYEPEESFEEEA